MQILQLQEVTNLGRKHNYLTKRQDDWANMSDLKLYSVELHFENGKGFCVSEEGTNLHLNNEVLEDIKTVIGKHLLKELTKINKEIEAL